VNILDFHYYAEVALKVQIIFDGGRLALGYGSPNNDLILTKPVILYL
jgi:hypothetical protein